MLRTKLIDAWKICSWKQLPISVPRGVGKADVFSSNQIHHVLGLCSKLTDLDASWKSQVWDALKGRSLPFCLCELTAVALRWVKQGVGFLVVWEKFSLLNTYYVLNTNTSFTIVILRDFRKEVWFFLFCLTVLKGQCQGLHKTRPSSQSYEVIATLFESRSVWPQSHLYCHSLLNIEWKEKQSKFCGFLLMSGFFLHLISLCFQ